MGNINEEATEHFCLQNVTLDIRFCRITYIREHIWLIQHTSFAKMFVNLFYWRRKGVCEIGIFLFA